MKIPSSSSLLLATLAVSTSTSVLGAPASQNEGGMSNSNQSRIPPACQPHPPSDSEKEHARRGDLLTGVAEDVRNIISSVPLIGPILVGQLGGSSNDQQNMEAIQAGVNELNRLVNDNPNASNATAAGAPAAPATPVQGAIGQVGSTLPGPAQGAPNKVVSALPGPAQGIIGQSDPASPSDPAAPAPSSPPMSGNPPAPPNSPAGPGA